MSHLVISSVLVCLSIISSQVISAAPLDADQLQSKPQSPSLPLTPAKDSAKDTLIDSNNWSVTQNWLISSINQLKSEMNQLGHSFNDHVSVQESDEKHGQQSLAHDMAVLRADHTILSQQQQLLIRLLKERQEQPLGPTLIQVQERVAAPLLESSPSREERQHADQEDSNSTSDEQADDEAKDSPRRHHRKHRHHHKHHHHHQQQLLLDKLSAAEKGLEAKSEQEIGDLSSQVTQLRDVTIAMFKELQDMEQKEEREDP